MSYKGFPPLTSGIVTGYSLGVRWLSSVPVTNREEVTRFTRSTRGGSHEGRGRGYVVVGLL